MKTPDIIVADQEPKFLSILERVSEGYISPSEAFAEMRPLLLAALTEHAMELEIKLAALGEFAVADWNEEVVSQVDKAVPEPTRYKDFLRTLFVKHPEQIKELQEEVAKLKAATISGFYEDESPQFRQGYPEHELEELVTAEEVTGYITKIRQLNAQITELLEQK